MWTANFDLFLQMEHVPEIRDGIRRSLESAWSGLASLFLGVEETTIDRNTARTVGAFHHALMIGVMAQLLVDQKQAPTAHDLTEALRSLIAK